MSSTDVLLESTNHSALLSWKWSQSGGPTSIEETAILLVNSAHVALNGFNYIQAGEPKAGFILLIASAIEGAAYATQVSSGLSCR